MEEDGEQQAFATRISGCMPANSIQGEGEGEKQEEEEEEEDEEEEARFA